MLTDIKNFIGKKVKIQFSMQWQNCKSQHIETGIIQSIQSNFDYKEGEITFNRDMTGIEFIPVKNVLSITTI
jgi:hypothetical protein